MGGKGGGQGEREGGEGDREDKRSIYMYRTPNISE